jgi:hypothetical protein
LSLLHHHAKDPRELGLEIERTLDNLKATRNEKWALIDLGPGAEGLLFRHRC